MTRRWLTALATGALLAALVLVPSSRAATSERSPTPLLAHYYIWFNVASWDRAKRDYPLLGRYSSDERRVMQKHVEWAREAGIDGFLVSWKSTPILNSRLENLVDVASSGGFKLALVYQGLDFSRQPLPAERIAADLEGFAGRYARHPVFGLFGKPVVVWSGTWRFSRDEVAQVAAAARGRLLLLASEKSVEGYERIAELVDGNAYYWSSVDPETTPGYGEKLSAFSAAVHAHGGLWFAPAAPGFDARDIGGTRVVDRRGGDTLRRALDAALQSSPDAIALITWNEFSENTHVEPSVLYGTSALEVIADARGARAPTIEPVDSSTSPASGFSYGVPLLAAAVTLGLAGLALIVRRRARGVNVA